MELVVGFITFIFWLMVMYVVTIIYKDKQPQPKLLEKSILVIGIVTFTGLLLWLFNCHFEWLMMLWFWTIIIVLALGTLLGFLGRRR